MCQSSEACDNYNGKQDVVDPDLRQEDGVYKSATDSVEATPLSL